MYEPLVPCPSCKRHVRASEDHCPFCSADLKQPGLLRASAPSAASPGRLTRAAAFVFGASLTVAACGTDETGGGSSSSSGGDAGSAADSGPDDDGGVIALYGDPAPDGGPDDGGSGMPKYGAPPPPDGGTDAG